VIMTQSANPPLARTSETLFEEALVGAEGLRGGAGAAAAAADDADADLFVARGVDTGGEQAH